MKSRRCEVCGGRTGAITCYRTMFHLIGSSKSYAHTKCFENFRNRRERREADERLHGTNR